jgi:hypothetical protein
MLAVLAATPTQAQQLGNAYIRFDYTTGELRMSPGEAVDGSNGIDSFEVQMDAAIGALSTDSADYFFPSGTYSPFFPPTTGADPGNAIGSAFATYGAPNVTGGGDSLNSTNLVIGSAWAYPTAVPGSTAVYASTIPGYEGFPEFSFGFIGPTTLTEAQALSAFGATSQGDFATGQRVYTLSNKAGTQSFIVFTVPEPLLGPLVGLGVIAFVASRIRRNNK